MSFGGSYYGQGYYGGGSVVIVILVGTSDMPTEATATPFGTEIAPTTRTTTGRPLARSTRTTATVRSTEASAGRFSVTAAPTTRVTMAVVTHRQTTATFIGTSEGTSPEEPEEPPTTGVHVLNTLGTTPLGWYMTG